MRLNWHVAERAARDGGVLLLDATRSALKRFPDALAKTVPIWAAVLNWAVAEHRQKHESADAASLAPWRAGVALPPWIEPREAAAIDARVAGWAASLAAVGADIAGLSAALRRPLRCLWLSQAAPLWALPQPDALPFTPLLCLSASAPLRGAGHTRASNQACDADDTSAADDADTSEPLSRAYVYIPGAGDDDETWARGLTPSLFWAHRGALLSVGAGDIAAAVDALVAAQAPSQPSAHPEAGAGAWRDARFAAAAPPPLAVVPTGKHDLPPAGTRAFAPAAASPAVPMDAGGAVWLADTRLGCASFAVLNAGAAIWRTTDALLLCGDSGGEDATADVAAALAAPPGAVLAVRVARAKAERASLLAALPAALAFARGHLAAGRTVLIACPDGRERAPAVAVALLAACFAETDHDPSDAPQPPAGPPRVRFLASPPDAAGCEGVSKVALRRWLALVSAHHAEARPTRGLLKQAFAFLRGGADAPDGDDF